MKDIFIDVQIANKFANAPDGHYSKLINWLLFNDRANPQNNAVLMLSEKLINKYTSGSRLCDKATSINRILTVILAERRFTMISNEKIKEFRRKEIDNNKKLNIICNSEDKDHFPLIFFSVRNLMLSDDEKFIVSVINFPRFGKRVMAARKPQDLNYE